MFFSTKTFFKWVIRTLEDHIINIRWRISCLFACTPIMICWPLNRPWVKIKMISFVNKKSGRSTQVVTRFPSLSGKNAKESKEASLDFFREKIPATTKYTTRKAQQKECRPLPRSSFPHISWFPPYVLVQLHKSYLQLSAECCGLVG